MVIAVSIPNRQQTLHWLGVLLLVVIVVPFVIYAVPTPIGGDGSYVVLSGSMEPSISTGDIVIVDEVDPRTIEEGDVITYGQSGTETPTTHRVVDVLDQDGAVAFQTQGDANDQPDSSPVPASAVHGKAILTIPYIGYIIGFVNTTIGFVTLVVIPFLLLIASEFSSLFRDEQDESTPPSETETRGPVADTAGTASESTTSEEATLGPAPEPTEATDEEETIAITRADLRLSLALLGGITIYAGWVVTLIQAPWSLAVVFAAGFGLLSVGGMYYLVGSQAPADEQVDHGDPDERAQNTSGTETDEQVRAAGGDSDRSPIDRTGSRLIGDREYPQVTVDSVSALTDEWIIEDTETGQYHVFQSEIVRDYHPETPADDTAAEQPPGSPVAEAPLKRDDPTDSTASPEPTVHGDQTDPEDNAT